MIKEIKGDDFEEIKASGIAVADFSASWCGPCKMMAPVFHAAAQELSDVSFFGVDVDENPNLAVTNKVFSVPTIILFKNGVEVARSVGAISRTALYDFIESNKR